jgi:hypothetical protein
MLGWGIERADAVISQRQLSTHSCRSRRATIGQEQSFGSWRGKGGGFIYLGSGK